MKGPFTQPQLLEWVQATLPRIRHDYANVLPPQEGLFKA
jgi:hypothetical protein